MMTGAQYDGFGFPPLILDRVFTASISYSRPTGGGSEAHPASAEEAAGVNAREATHVGRNSAKVGNAGTQFDEGHGGGTQLAAEPVGTPATRSGVGSGIGGARRNHGQIFTTGAQ